MKCRANNAEREAEMLKEQLDRLKDQFNEVCNVQFDLLACFVSLSCFFF